MVDFQKIVLSAAHTIVLTVARKYVLTVARKENHENPHRH
jgi:hypothetical protein